MLKEGEEEKKVRGAGREGGGRERKREGGR